MVHDPDLLDRLDSYPKEQFAGDVFRATRINLNPLAGTYNGGRWMKYDAAAIVYTSLERDGALAEIVFHWSQLNPLPTKPVVVHRLQVNLHRIVRLNHANLAKLGISESNYKNINPARTQEIGAASEFLGCDGLIAPSARWNCESLMLFPQSMNNTATLELKDSENVDWIKWGKTNGLIVDA